MGPFPHEAPKATISDSNPAGTDGFEFVEYAHPEPEVLDRIFRQMGFEPVAKHKTKNGPQAYARPGAPCKGNLP